MTQVFLDHNATTPLDPAACDEMMPWLRLTHGNPSSLHALGQEARRAMDRARCRCARLIGAQPDEILFTSGGTEANNLAILGTLSAAGDPRPHVVTTAVEHQAVLNPCAQVRRAGGTVTLAPVDVDGTVAVDRVLAALQTGTRLVSVMLANNDVGTVEPVAAIAAGLRGRGIPLHTDAVQAAGKMAIDVDALGVDFLSLSGHKFHGPQGIGALYVRRGTRLKPILFGGHQERGLRPGTENVAAIVGFGKACELAHERLQADATHVRELRDRFEDDVCRTVPGATVNGQGAPRLPNTTNLSFASLDGEALVIHLDLLGLAASTGAACSSADDEPSHVLLAMGRTPAAARSAVRFSFGRDNTLQEVARAVSLLDEAARRLRESRR